MRDTIDIAREAGVYKDCDWRYGMKAEEDALKTFEALVRADEREACALTCEGIAMDDMREDSAAQACAAAIRARGNT
jgi:hypothetical protein